MHKAHVAKWKKDEYSRLKEIIPEYKVVAVADMTNVPSYQLQKMRSSLKNSVFITMAKGSVMSLVLKDLAKSMHGIEKLVDQMHGMPALLLSNDNPFKVAKVLKKSRATSPAKGGQIAPNDIFVPAGPTSFPPGPIIGELGQVGLKAGIVDGKVAIKEDKIILKEGQVFSSMLANILTRLGIEPMEIGINLVAAWENGTIFAKDVLNFDDVAFMSNIKTAASSAFNLAFYISFPTKDNIKLLLQKSFRETNALAESKNILTANNVKKHLAEASLEMESLKSKLGLPEVMLDPKSGS